MKKKLPIFLLLDWLTLTLDSASAEWVSVGLDYTRLSDKETATAGSRNCDRTNIGILRRFSGQIVSWTVEECSCLQDLWWWFPLWGSPLCGWCLSIGGFEEACTAGPPPESPGSCWNPRLPQLVQEHSAIWSLWGTIQKCPNKITLDWQVNTGGLAWLGARGGGEGASWLSPEALK